MKHTALGIIGLIAWLAVTLTSLWLPPLRSATIVTTNSLTNIGFLDVGALYVTNSPPFSARDLIFKAKSNGEITNLVNELLATGEVCRVRGHAWGAFAENYLYAVVRPDGYQARKCQLCGAVQERTMQPWPTP